MIESFCRIDAMVRRYLYLHKRSLMRFLELFFWPLMDLLVWGFLTLYVQRVTVQGMSQYVVFLINGVIFWQVLIRNQQSVSISVMEEIWRQNILNILVSPLKIWEWMAATFIYGLVKTLAVAAILALLAYLFYHFNMIDQIGIYLFPLLANLILFSWVLGVVTTGLILRWGYSVEALIWGIPFLFQPLSAIYYPLSVFPAWLQKISLCIPATYVFEGMRAILGGKPFTIGMFLIPLALNGFYFVLAAVCFEKLLKDALRNGRVVRLGLD